MRKFSDKEYFERFQAGEEAAFAYFFRLYWKPLVIYAKEILKYSPMAEDIVEESFINVWGNRMSIRGVSGLKSYLYKSVFNACLRWKENVLNRSVGDISEQTEKFEERDHFENMVHAEVLQSLHRAIESLPQACRQVFVKLYIEGKTVREVAEELSLAISTVKTQKQRGLQLLKLRVAHVNLTSLLIILKEIL